MKIYDTKIKAFYINKSSVLVWKIIENIIVNKYLYKWMKLSSF